LLSIIIPTFNERQNVPVMIERIDQTLLGSVPYEILFVDDSTDDTPCVLAEMARKNPRVRFFHRMGERGLATAVMRGFAEARGEVLAVMDADLQHPPELLPQMFQAIEQGYDLVIPSRFVPGGDDGGLSPMRKLVSFGARMIGRTCLTKVRPCTDPTGGFFMLRRTVIENVELHPLGWKILMEILVRGRYKQMVEIPYRFQRRLGDRSKMSLREQIQYIRHVGRLMKASPEDWRFFKFLLVGLSGVGVNLVVFTFLFHMLGQRELTAATVAATVSMFSNFLLHDRFTWRGMGRGIQWIRLIKYGLVSSLGLMIQVGIICISLEWWGWHSLMANLAGIAGGTLWNYIANNRWTWSAQEWAVPAKMRKS
jgi:dolichol-phosphate mannosyltransferase